MSYRSTVKSNHAMDQETIRHALTDILALKDGAKEDWEKSLVNMALSLISRKGSAGVTSLDKFLEDLTSGKDPDQTILTLIGHELSLTEASDILASLQSKEADHMLKARSLLKKILLAAETAGSLLLKAALGGLV